jgi:hypothetical protein
VVGIFKGVRSRAGGTHGCFVGEGCRRASPFDEFDLDGRAGITPVGPLDCLGRSRGPGLASVGRGEGQGVNGSVLKK